LEDFQPLNNENSGNQSSKKTTLLGCGHRFCDECLNSWFNNKTYTDQKCPICRKHWSDYDSEEKESKQASEIDEKKQDERDSHLQRERQTGNGDLRHRKTEPNETGEQIDEEVYDGVSHSGHRRRVVEDMVTDDWLWRQELRFRLMRLRHYYPRYVDETMVHRWSDAPDTLTSHDFANDTCFASRAPFSTTSRSSSSSRGGSSFSFGGGSSSGGGGGGGTW